VRCGAAQRGSAAILSLNIRSGERDEVVNQIAHKEHLSPLEESILNLARDLESVRAARAGTRAPPFEHPAMSRYGAETSHLGCTGAGAGADRAAVHATA
jgi:hypothetical protein